MFNVAKEYLNYGNATKTKRLQSLQLSEGVQKGSDIKHHKEKLSEGLQTPEVLRDGICREPKTSEPTFMTIITIISMITILQCLEMTKFHGPSEWLQSLCGLWIMTSCLVHSLKAQGFAITSILFKGPSKKARLIFGNPTPQKPLNVSSYFILHFLVHLVLHC